jgi:hypothetical protein
MKISNKVDKLAQIRAEINALKVIEGKLEASLKEMGIGQHEGSEHYVTVYEQAGPIKIDWEAIAMKLNPSPQLKAAHTKPGKDRIVLKLFGYPANKRAVAA